MAFILAAPAILSSACGLVFVDLRQTPSTGYISPDPIILLFYSYQGLPTLVDYASLPSHGLSFPLSPPLIFAVFGGHCGANRRSSA
jgi:hypothetical protein